MDTQKFAGVLIPGNIIRILEKAGSKLEMVLLLDRKEFKRCIGRHRKSSISSKALRKCAVSTGSTHKE